VAVRVHIPLGVLLRRKVPAMLRVSWPKIRRLVRIPLTWALVAFVLIGSAWMLTTPPAGGVDEASHYVRTVGLSQGQLLGDAVDLERPFAGLEGEQLRRVNAEASWFTMPGDRPIPSCHYFLDAARAFDCPRAPAQLEAHREISLHGRSLPGAYAVPAIFSWLGTETVSALAWARVGVMITNLVMVIIVARALGAIWRRTGPPGMSAVVLLALSVTPVVAFFSATLAPSSVEIWSAAAFTAALVAFSQTRSSVWLIVTVALAVFASWTRDLGAIAVGVATLAVIVLEPGIRNWWKEQVNQRRRWLVLGVVSLGVMSALWWQLAFKYPLRPSIGSRRQVFDDGITVLQVLRQGIGLGGWLNTPMDATLEKLWLAGWLIAAGAVLWQVSIRVRWVLTALTLVTGGMGLYLVAMMRAAGFGLQARFLLPLVAVMVIIATTSSTSTSKGRPTVIRQIGLGIIFALIALAHGSALLIAAHRHARGLNGRPIDFSESTWTPPGGWTLSAVMAIIGCLCLAAIPWSPFFQPDKAEIRVTGEHPTLS